jgi:A/G-specific adenine glycosylase
MTATMTADETVIKISEKKSATFRGKMLNWYDQHRRTIPWRAEKGQISDPYHVWLSEIMCQQTTVPAVVPYFLEFIRKWPGVEDLATAERDAVMSAWAGLGYYARARNLHKCAQMIANNYGGKFPDTKQALQELPGIGDYTSAAIAAIAFNRAETVVDGNIERVMARQFNIQTPMPKAKKPIKAAAAQFFERETARPGDLAQALMDLGSAICIPKNPKCVLCPVRDSCQAYKLGNPESLPVKAPKKTKPQKSGIIYWIENGEDEILLHRRSDDEMLGGTLALPTGLWEEGADHPNHAISLDKATLSNANLSIKHSFTHFDLILHIYKGNINPDSLGAAYTWRKKTDINPAHFPTVFKKAVVLCLDI